MTTARFDGVRIRRATPDDIPDLKSIIDDSICTLGAPHYTDAQLQSALQHLFGVDRQLIDDGTYYVAERRDALVASGGWSRRQTPTSGDRIAGRRDPDLRDPATDPAVIRALFVRPEWTRNGLGHALLERCETDARDHGFTRFELTALRSGHAFYQSEGYRDVETIDLPLPDGVEIEVVVMAKP